ncbi:MAG TPA: YceI family protein [Polyangiales bacterium]
MNKACTLALWVALIGCDNDPAQGKTMAKVSAPAVTTQASSSSTAANKYVFSNAGSKLEFVGAKVTRKHEGAFHVFSGAIDLVEAEPQKSVATLEIATASLTADDPKLTEHLKSPDLLDVVKYPKATFRSTSIAPSDAPPATHSVTGNLALHGVTKSITFPVTVHVRGDALDVEAEFAIDRKQFGVVYPGMPDDLIKDEVLLKAQLHGMKMPLADPH